MEKKQEFRITQNNFERPINSSKVAAVLKPQQIAIAAEIRNIRNAVLLLSFSFVLRLGKSSCRDNEFQCINGKCIFMRDICDNEFQCINGKCIFMRDVCDHHNDCGDNSDEPRTDSALCGMWNNVFKMMIYIFVSSGTKDK